MTATAVAADTVLGRMETLASCLCAAVSVANTPDVCFCGVMPGNQVAIDYVHGCSDDVCGMAWVRLATTYPSNSLGQGGGITPTANTVCMWGLGADIEVGMARCFPIPEDGGPPDPAVLLSVTELQVADMQTMRNAVLCCTGTKDWLLGGYTPFGPTGGAIGGTWTVTTLVV